MSTDAIGSSSPLPEQLLSDLSSEPPSTTAPQYSPRDFGGPPQKSWWKLALVCLGLGGGVLGAAWVFEQTSKGLFGAVSHHSTATSQASGLTHSPAPESHKLAHPADSSTESADKIPTVPLVDLMNGSRTIPREPITMQRFLEDPKIQQLQEKLDQLELSVATLNDALETQKKTSEEQFSALTAKFQTIQKAQLGSVSATSSSVSRVKPLASVSRARENAKPSGRSVAESSSRSSVPVKIPVPFALVSIDRWGDATDVVVRYHGTLTHLTAEQPLGAWRLVDVDASGKTISVSNAQGQTVHLAQP